MNYPGLMSIIVISLVLPQVTQGAIIFSEDFNAENGGISQLDYNAFAQFSISGGSVDIISAVNPYSITCASGSCVDLDGSTRNAGIMTTDAVNLSGGVNYTFSFDISGNQRGRAIDTVYYGVTGAESFEILNLASGDPYQTVAYHFTVATDGFYSLFFHNQGGDNSGAILDNVTVSYNAVPVPAALPLLLAALGSLVFQNSRRSA